MRVDLPVKSGTQAYERVAACSAYRVVAALSLRQWRSKGDASPCHGWRAPHGRARAVANLTVKTRSRIRVSRVEQCHRRCNAAGRIHVGGRNQCQHLYIEQFAQRTLGKIAKDGVECRDRHAEEKQQQYE